MATGTIFDSWYYAPERPVFTRIAELSDEALSVLLFIAAIVIIFIALQKGRPLLKAVVLSYIIIP